MGERQAAMTREVAVTSSKRMELELELVRKEKRQSFVRLSSSSSPPSHRCQLFSRRVPSNTTFLS